MSKVKRFLTDFPIIMITLFEFGLFICLYSAVELFNKIFKNKKICRI